MSEKYLDCNGIPFADYRRELPIQVFHFPKANIIKSPELLQELHNEWDCCQVCGRRAGLWTKWDAGPQENWVSLHLHHVIGAAGRSDERCNLLALCSEGPDQGCHAEAHGGKLPLGKILYHKWKADPDGIDWIRLAVLRGSFLPELIVEE